MALLEAQEVHAFYGRSYVLQGVSITVQEGEVVALLGRNGAGKTTFLKTIMGLVRACQGRVILDGVDITALPSYRIARLGIGYVPQGRGLFPELTVLENLKTGMCDRRDKGSLERVLDLFPLLRDRLGQKAGTLSGGEQQALAIARALLQKPRILLLDEPTTGLMPLIVERLKEVIRELNSRGIAILLVEEKVPFALSLAHRVYFMVKGKMTFSAPKEEVASREDILLKYLGVQG